jgi:Tfp pilus assembly protein PilF
MRQQRYENSIALFLRSLQHDQTRCVTHIALGNAYASLQQIDNAMESYKRAIYYEPSNSEPYWLRGMYFVLLVCSARLICN